MRRVVTARKHPRARLLQRLGIAHINMGCPQCKTMLDAFGHLALLKHSGYVLWREDKNRKPDDRLGKRYDGYVYGDKVWSRK